MALKAIWNPPRTLDEAVAENAVGGWRGWILPHVSSTDTAGGADDEAGRGRLGLMLPMGPN
jgi:hypothetical protein